MVGQQRNMQANCGGIESRRPCHGNLERSFAHDSAAYGISITASLLRLNVREHPRSSYDFAIFLHLFRPSPLDYASRTFRPPSSPKFITQQTSTALSRCSQAALLAPLPPNLYSNHRLHVRYRDCRACARHFPAMYSRLEVLRRRSSRHRGHAAPPPSTRAIWSRARYGEVQVRQHMSGLI